MNPQSYRLSYKYRFVKGFLRALKRINSQKSFVSSSNNYSHGEISKRYLKVKSAAYASMASAVGSKRAWSRAMLQKIIFNRNNSLRRRRSNKLISTIVKNKRCLEAYKKEKDVNKEIFEAKELRKVVPGGEAMDFCSLLDETAHYIKCLATQVKMMRRIAHVYSTYN